MDVSGPERDESEDALAPLFRGEAVDLDRLVGMSSLLKREASRSVAGV
jgi:hypothetical protein